jgi:hypothetical protein
LAWYRHPLFWIGIGSVVAVRYALYRKRQGTFGALPRRGGGIVLPAGLLSRKLPAPTPPEQIEPEPDDTPDDEPPDESGFPPRDSTPPQEEPPDWEPPEFSPPPPPSSATECEIVPSATARLHAKKRSTLIDWNDPNFAVTHLCHAPLRAKYLPASMAAAEPNRFCHTFCQDVGWKAGICADDKCVCANNIRGR